MMSALGIKAFRDEPGAAPAPADAAPAPADAPWHASLAEDIRADMNLTKYGSVEEFARGHLATVKKLGVPADRLLEMPTEDNAEGRVAVLRKLGASEDAAAYALKAVDGVDEALSPEGALAKMFSAAAHKHALLPGQAQSVYADLAQELHKTLAAQGDADALAGQEGVAALKQEWGAAYDQNVAAARFGVEQIGGKELAERFDHYGLENDPVFARAMHKVGLLLSEDGAGDTNQPGTFRAIMAPAEAQAKGAELLRQANRTSDIGEKRRLNVEASRYFKMAYPEDA